MQSPPLVHGLGPARAADHLETLKTDALIDEVYADERVQAAAGADWIRRFDDQPFTLTDAASFAVMRARRIRAAFTFDQHLASRGSRRFRRGGGGVRVVRALKGALGGRCAADTC